LRAAALYDVHGNLPALEAVLVAVETAGPDLIVFGGDVAAGPFPLETIERLRRIENARFVRGNADRYMVEVFEFRRTTYDRGGLRRSSYAKVDAFREEHSEEEAIEFFERQAAATGT
jgi:predicted phosphodiesterase